MGGALAETYGGLLEEIWGGKASYLAPRSFKVRRRRRRERKGRRNIVHGVIKGGHQWDSENGLSPLSYTTV